MDPFGEGGRAAKQWETLRRCAQGAFAVGQGVEVFEYGDEGGSVRVKEGGLDRGEGKDESENRDLWFEGRGVNEVVSSKE